LSTREGICTGTETYSIGDGIIFYTKIYFIYFIIMQLCAKEPGLKTVKTMIKTSDGLSSKRFPYVLSTNCTKKSTVKGAQCRLCGIVWRMLTSF
jgi:hypothetical protein